MLDRRAARGQSMVIVQVKAFAHILLIITYTGVGVSEVKVNSHSIVNISLPIVHNH